MLVQAMVGEPLAAVRCVALRCLGRVLEGVDSLPPSDAKIINECDLASSFWLQSHVPYVLKLLDSTTGPCGVSVSTVACMSISLAAITITSHTSAQLQT